MVEGLVTLQNTVWVLGASALDKTKAISPVFAPFREMKKA